MAIQRMDNVGIVVEDLAASIAFFRELGLELEGQATIEGEWAGRVTGLGDQHVEVAMMRTPDGHGRLELSRFLTPPVIADHRNAPVNALGYLRVMFAVDDLDDTLTRLREHGVELVAVAQPARGSGPGRPRPPRSFEGSGRTARAARRRGNPGNPARDHLHKSQVVQQPGFSVRFEAAAGGAVPAR